MVDKRNTICTKKRKGYRIDAIAYNQKADYCYRTLKIGSDVIIEGKLNSKLNIIVTRLYINKKV